MRLTGDSTIAYAISRTQSLPRNVTRRARRGLHGADSDSGRGDPTRALLATPKCTKAGRVPLFSLSWPVDAFLSREC